jgi:hypothetical protein
MRVDRHRDFDVAVADDVPDDVRRDAEVEQERRAGVADVVEAEVARQADVLIRPQLLRRLSGSNGVPRTSIRAVQITDTPRPTHGMIGTTR